MALQPYLVEYITSNNFHSINLKDYSLDELTQIHNNLLKSVSEDFHNGMNAIGGHTCLMCDKIMAEIKDRLIYTAI